jgi:hypothetical protein
VSESAGTQQGGLTGIGPWLPRGCCRLQSLASWLLALASRSESRLRVRWGKSKGEPSAVGLRRSPWWRAAPMGARFGPVFRESAGGTELALW